MSGRLRTIAAEQVLKDRRSPINAVTLGEQRRSSRRSGVEEKRQSENTENGSATWNQETSLSSIATS